MTQVTGKNVISRWEKGVNILDIEKLMNVAYLGETTVPYLLYGSTYKRMLKQKKRKTLSLKNSLRLI